MLMLVLKIVGLSIGSLVFLFILTKILGNRSMSQLSMFDYIVSITVGSIAAEMATSLDDNFVEPLIAMLIYTIIPVLIDILTSKSIKLRRYLSSQSLILLDNGKLYKENFKKCKLDLNEFLMQCRDSGYFNLSDIQTAILESNRKSQFPSKCIKKVCYSRGFKFNSKTRRNN